MEKFGNNIESGRLNENEAFLAQEIASKKERIGFNEQASEVSYRFAEELMGELKESGMSLDGLNWGLVRDATSPEEIESVIKDYAETKGVDMLKVDEFLADTKSDTSDFSRIKKFAFAVSFLATLVGGPVSESYAAPLSGENHTQAFSKEQMAQMKDAVIFGEREILGAQEEFQDDIEAIKHANAEIADIRISHVRVSQKVVNEKDQVTPAVVVEMVLKISTKDGREVLLHDTSYENINTGYTHSAGFFRETLEYAVKNGWVSAEVAGHSGAWKKDLRNRFQYKLMRESMQRLGEQIKGMK